MAVESGRLRPEPTGVEWCIVEAERLPESKVQRVVRLDDGTLTVPRTGPEAVTEACIQIEERLAAADLFVDRYWAPGLAESSIRGQLRNVGLTAPDELVALYSWRNGFRGSKWRLEPLFGFEIAPLETVVSAAKSQNVVKEGALKWDAPMVILEGDIRGHAVLCDSPPSVAPVIMEFSEAQSIRGERYSPKAISICTWLLSIIRAHDIGYFVRDREPAGRAWRTDLTKREELESEPYFF